MNREILFRGKLTDNGEWVEGYVIKDDITGQVFIHTLGNSVNESQKIGEEGCLSFVAFEVDPATVCQYTGLTDKNGKRIWENDITKCYADTDDLGNDLYFFYKVIWHEKYYCWWLSDIHTMEDEYLHEYNPNDIEVIGNIFDNKELLEV